MATVTLRIGTDHRFDFTILNAAQTEAVDISGWALSWMVKRSTSDEDADAILTKTTVSGITITGTYDADPDVNTQLARVSIADDDTDDLTPQLGYYELKRTDAGFETVLDDGLLELDYAVHRA